MRAMLIVGFLASVAIVAPSGAPAADALSCVAPQFGPRTPDDVRGSLFIGYYIDDEQDRDWYTVSNWNVDRVYGDTSVPANLDFRTPPCEEATVARNHRYLFSTSDIDEPDIHDSVAWRILGDGKISFAPMGPTRLSDYADDDPFVAIQTLEEALALLTPNADERPETVATAVPLSRLRCRPGQ
jgi:hypothetical protein